MKQKYLKILQQEIHSVIIATIDSNSKPVTCVIDVMLADENGLYFLTAKGKAFYERLLVNPFVSITGMKGQDTMSSKSITVRGKVRELGGNLIGEIFEINSYMAEIYPNQESRSVLTVFQLYQGEGEFFDLSVKPIFREKFSFGNGITTESGYFINSNCIGCKKCYDICPQKCIDIPAISAVIKQENCLYCGKCAEVCPAKAIEKR